jgi:hypothetical protein
MVEIEEMSMSAFRNSTIEHISVDKNNWVSVTLREGTLPRRRLLIKEQMSGVADWSRKYATMRVEDEVIVEPKFYLKLLIAHEAIEAHITKTFGVRWQEAHLIAQKLEKKYCVKHHGLKQWKLYTQWVNYISEKEQLGY